MRHDSPMGCARTRKATRADCTNYFRGNVRFVQPLYSFDELLSCNVRLGEMYRHQLRSSKLKGQGTPWRWRVMQSAAVQCLTRRPTQCLFAPRSLRILDRTIPVIPRREPVYSRTLHSG